MKIKLDEQDLLKLCTIMFNDKKSRDIVVNIYTEQIQKYLEHRLNTEGFILILERLLEDKKQESLRYIDKSFLSLNEMHTKSLKILSTLLEEHTNWIIENLQVPESDKKKEAVKYLQQLITDLFVNVRRAR